MHRNPFSDEELATRLSRLRVRMATLDLDAALLSAPENVFYLTGLDHWGYFAPHLLVVPLDGEMILVTRAMERVSVEKQVRNARFAGHADTEGTAEVAACEIGRLKPRRIGFESASAGLTPAAAHQLETAVADAEWVDITGLVDDLRLVKSLEEQALLRAAARVTDAGAEAAIAAVGDGARERDVAAECLAAMIRAGGDTPGFGPFIRPGSRLGEEHATWGDGAYRNGEPVFLELSGCVSRYHAPLGRLVHLGGISDADASMAETAAAAFDAVVTALRPGATAGSVYQAWQDVVDDAGLPHYRRHHCGYLVGIGFPPSWTGGNRVMGLRAGSDLVLESGMSFHILSWLMGTGRGDYFLSNPVLMTADSAEVLSSTPFGPIVK